MRWIKCCASRVAIFALIWSHLASASRPNELPKRARHGPQANHLEASDDMFHSGAHGHTELREKPSATIERRDHLQLQTRQLSDTSAKRLARLQQFKEQLFSAVRKNDDQVADEAFVAGHHHHPHGHAFPTLSRKDLADEGFKPEPKAAGLDPQQLTMLGIASGVLVAMSFLLVWRSKRNAKVPKDAELIAFPKGTVTSFLHIWCMTCSQFPFGFMISNMTLMVFPLVAKELFPSMSSVALGGFFVVVALSMLFGPLAGQISDSLKHPWGRRRPALFLGTQIIVFCTIGMWLASKTKNGCVFIVCLLIQQIVFNSVNTVQFAVVADLVAPESAGVGAGIQLANTVSGAIAGIICFQLFAVTEVEYHWNYAVLMVFLEVLTGLSIMAMREVDTNKVALPPHLDWTRPFQATQTVYTLDLDDHPDFKLIIQERSLYYAGISCKAYILFLIRDIFHVDTLPEQATLLARFAFLSEGMAAAVAVLIAVLFERGWIDAKPVAIVGCLIMGVSCQFELCAFIEDPGFRIQVFTMQSIAFGIGQAMYLTGDLAVAIRVMPSIVESSKLLGLALGISAFVGGGIGSLASALLLDLFGRIIPEASGQKLKPGTYGLAGYTVVLIGMLVCLLTSAVYLARISKTPRDSNVGPEEPEEEPDDQPKTEASRRPSLLGTSRRPSLMEAAASTRAI